MLFATWFVFSLDFAVCFGSVSRLHIQKTANIDLVQISCFLPLFVKNDLAKTGFPGRQKMHSDDNSGLRSLRFHPDHCHLNDNVAHF